MSLGVRSHARSTRTASVSTLPLLELHLLQRLRLLLVLLLLQLLLLLLLTNIIIIVIAGRRSQVVSVLILGEVGSPVSRVEGRQSVCFPNTFASRFFRFLLGGC